MLVAEVAGGLADNAGEGENSNKNIIEIAMHNLCKWSEELI